ncbi:uncharacterized protein [Watersipora subatra]|uniref:uncharacterized protein isoform X2 n=1 Tax=Watersipora subatra TaxID=2589382 RepID=UPI00355BE5E2
MDELGIPLEIFWGAIALLALFILLNARTETTREENHHTWRPSYENTHYLRHNHRSSAPQSNQNWVSRHDDYKAGYRETSNRELIGLHHVRNEHRQVYTDNNRNRSRRELDLHGLFQYEALNVVDECLRTLKEKGYRTAVIITGKGNNSKGGIAVLKPAVEGYLQANQFWFVEQSGGGSFEVSL